jgi:hypothetical protein
MRYVCLITQGETTIASGAMTIACVSKRDKPWRSTGIPPEIAARFQVAPEASGRQ